VCVLNQEEEEKEEWSGKVHSLKKGKSTEKSQD
jgi:hypothetical protein